jgi:hypothetical protein
MRISETLAYWSRGTGRRRAADTIPVIEAQRNYWQARAGVLAERNKYADDLIAAMCCKNEQLERRASRAEHDLWALNDAHQHVLNDLDQLSRRYTALRMDHANRTAVSTAAPADAETTVVLGVGPLWNAHGLPTIGSAA